MSSEPKADERKRRGLAGPDVGGAAVDAAEEEARKARSHPEPVPQDTGSHRTPPIHPPLDLVKTWMNASVDPDRGGQHNGFLHTLDDPADQSVYEDWYRQHKETLPPDHQNIDLTGLWLLNGKEAGALHDFYGRELGRRGGH